jgi:hypothetical protein
MLKESSRVRGLAVSWVFVISMATASMWLQTASATNAPTVSFSALPALQVTTPKPGTTHVPGDFNGDGVSDLLWFNPTLSQVGYWTMSTSSGVVQTSVQKYNVTSGYFVGAVGDFNNDGYADIVFTSAQNDLWLWTNDQHGGFTSTEIGTYPSNWELIGAGDVDGDGYDDLLWLDPVDCKFAYWTMHGAVRTGFNVINIACGYYPVSIGYYTPSNRISIVWTSAANDVYIWDSTGSGFRSYNATSFFNEFLGGITNIWAFGGGYEGNGIGVEVNDFNGDGGGGLINRTFDENGNQTGFEGGISWEGGPGAWGSGGYLIEGNGVNETGLYAFGGNTTQGVNISTNDVYNGNATATGNATAFPGRWHWNVPSGWYVIGAPANHVTWPSSP